MLDKLDHQEATLRQTNRSATERVVQLQDALEERKAQFNDLATKYDIHVSLHVSPRPYTHDDRLQPIYIDCIYHNLNYETRTIRFVYT